MSDDRTTRLRTCTDWCVSRHDADPACWGKEVHHVALTTEAWDSAEHNSITAYAYRRTPAHREVVKLHLYRPSDHEHLYLDDEMHLTPDEARQLAAHLIAVADEIVQGELAAAGKCALCAGAGRVRLTTGRWNYTEACPDCDPEGFAAADVDPDHVIFGPAK